MKFARSDAAEKFDRSLRLGVREGAYVREVQVAAQLSTHEVRPNPVFTANLRAALVQAATEKAAQDFDATPQPARPFGPVKRRWKIAAPVIAVGLASGGVAFAATGFHPAAQASSGTTPPAASSALTSASAELITGGPQLTTVRPTAASLQSLRGQALRLQGSLVAAYASGENPRAMLELHAFAMSATSQLAALQGQVPSRLTPLYVSTLQTLRGLAATAETCPTCHPTPIQAPNSATPSAPGATTKPLSTRAVLTGLPTPPDLKLPSTTGHPVVAPPTPPRGQENLPGSLP